MKKWYESKTLWFNIIGLIVTAAAEFTTAFPTGTIAKVSGFVLTVGNIILRMITSASLTK